MYCREADFKIDPALMQVSSWEMCCAPPISRKVVDVSCIALIAKKVEGEAPGEPTVPGTLFSEFSAAGSIAG